MRSCPCSWTTDCPISSPDQVVLAVPGATNSQRGPNKALRLLGFFNATGVTATSTVVVCRLLRRQAPAGTTRPQRPRPSPPKPRWQAVGSATVVGQVDRSSTRTPASLSRRVVGQSVQPVGHGGHGSVRTLIESPRSQERPDRPHSPVARAVSPRRRGVSERTTHCAMRVGGGWSLPPSESTTRLRLPGEDRSTGA
jgi:hypothetical protein